MTVTAQIRVTYSTQIRNYSTQLCNKMASNTISQCDVLSHLTVPTAVNIPIVIPNAAVPGEFLLVYHPSADLTSQGPDNDALAGITFPDAKRAKLEDTNGIHFIEPDVNTQALPKNNVAAACEDFVDVKQEQQAAFTSFSENLPDADYVTPTTMRTRSLSSDCDGNGDYRFGDPLFSLLSTPPNSPTIVNPFFDNIKSTLAEEFKECVLPSTLLTLMPKQQEIPTREQKLYSRFNKLNDAYPDAIHQLSGFYRYQTALIETERFRTLHEDTHSKSSQKLLKSHFDDKIHSIIDRVEKSVLLLEETDKMKKRACVNRSRPLLSRNAIRIMLDWYNAHIEHPYPETETIEWIAGEGKISVEQVKKWFANKRNRSCNTKKLSDIANRKRKLSLID